jgi:ribosomal protein S18 acetylase RimI-like enzyme
VKYQNGLEGISADALSGGFFEGWPDPPIPEAHLRILNGSSNVVLAIGEKNQVIGFITAISDGVSCAYIPYLEVLPEYRGQGIGKEMVRQMLSQLSDLYMIDLCCDENVTNFYDSFGFTRANAMILRNYNRQACN